MPPINLRRTVVPLSKILAVNYSAQDTNSWNAAFVTMIALVWDCNVTQTWREIGILKPDKCWF